MEKLTFLGIGPKIARVTIPFLVITIALTILFPSVFTFGKTLQEPFLIAGIIFLAVALLLYFITLRQMVPGIRGNRLITSGIYRLSRNPLYTSLILFLLPGLGLIMNSWLVLSTIIVGYLLFRKFIHEEEELLDRLFGDDYRKYREKTSLFFPNPFRKK
jgi:protein-S-isoprenylcysteine O-methyltransferase Ste14